MDKQFEEIHFPEVDLSFVKGVLIDIDNTLYAYEPAHFWALEVCYKKLAAMKSDAVKSFEDFSKAYRAKRTLVTERLWPQGACRSRLFAFQALFEDWGCELSFDLALGFETAYWEAFLSKMQLNSKAKAFLEACKFKKIKVCAVTDMQAHIQIKKLKALSVSHLIDYLTTSEEVGSEKPKSLIFKTALRKLNLKSSEVVMIGDHQEKDIIGAEKVGVKGIKVLVHDAKTVS